MITTTNDAKKDTNPYNPGVDFLRIFAMFMIVVTHVLGKGGIRSSVAGDPDPHFLITWAIQVAAYGAVNCYALISGYVSVNSNYRYSKCLTLWLQVFFYTFGFTVFFSLLQKPVTYHDWVEAIFPVITGEYWYITAYFGVLVFMPFLNLGLSKLKTKDLKQLVIFAIIFFSVLPALFNTKVDEFSFAKGFSMNWLIVLYIIGAYLRRLDLKRVFKKRTLLLLALSSMTVTFFAKFLIGDIWYWYTSPSLLAAALSVFIFFATLDIKADSRLMAVIKFLAPATLGVYLFHLNPLMVRFVIRDGFVSFVDAPIWLFPFLILGTALLIYFLSTVVELLRMRLFKTLKIGQLAQKLDNILPFGIYTKS
ncbi:acyltransferase [Streptococcus ferus]|uniref:acyltransferase n=1 Tax=Streptococcus ferus TaxID=1345 RepID=UPI0035A0D933